MYKNAKCVTVHAVRAWCVDVCACVRMGLRLYTFADTLVLSIFSLCAV